jgi:hypothetical protein
MTNHENDEPRVNCPVEDCDATPLARGINLHVRRSSGNGHGPQGEVPDAITFEDLDTVGTGKVEMDYPEERDTDNAGRRCPWCGKLFAGTQGVRIHLGQVAGRDGHPEDAPEQYDPRDQSRAEEEEYEAVPLWSNSEKSDGSSNGDATPPMIQTARIYEYIIDLKMDGRITEARRLRDRLCGPISPERPESLRAVFEAICREGRSSISPKVAVAESDGEIYIECQEAAALLASEDARWLANAMQLASEEENWSPKPEELILYLHAGAELINTDDTSDSSSE